MGGYNELERISCQTPILTHAILCSLLWFFGENTKGDLSYRSYPWKISKKNNTYTECKDEMSQKYILPNTNTENHEIAFNIET